MAALKVTISQSILQGQSKRNASSTSQGLKAQMIHKGQCERTTTTIEDSLTVQVWMESQINSARETIPAELHELQKHSEQITHTIEKPHPGFLYPTTKTGTTIRLSVYISTTNQPYMIKHLKARVLSNQRFHNHSPS